MFSFFEHASISVKKIIIEFIDKHLLNCKLDIAPTILLSLSPSLEDENSEQSGLVSAIFERIRITFGDMLFLKFMHIALQNTSVHKLPLLTLISSYDLNKFVFESNDVFEILKGYLSSLKDSSLLVNRAVLDILLNLKRFYD